MSRESQSADRPNNVLSVLRSNSFVEKAAWPWPRAVAEHVRGGAKTKDKGLLRNKDELTVSASWEARQCKSRSQGDSVASVVKSVVRVKEETLDSWWREQINYQVILIIIRYCD